MKHRGGKFSAIKRIQLQAHSNKQKGHITSKDNGILFAIIYFLQPLAQANDSTSIQMKDWISICYTIDTNFI